MKIICFTSRFHTNLYYRIRALMEAGHDVQVAVLYKGVSEYRTNVAVTELGLSRGTLLFEKILRKFKKHYLKSDLELILQRPDKKKLLKLLDDFEPDLILIKSYQDMFSERILKAVKKRKIPVYLLTQTRKNHLKGSVRLLKLYIKRLKKLGVKGFLTPVKINEQRFKEIGIDCVHYLPFVFPAPEFEKTYNPGGETAILAIGKFVRRKGHLLLLEAFCRLSKKYPGARLTLMGERADEEYVGTLLAFIEKNNLKNRVCLQFNLSYEKALEQYKKHDLFILPSYEEPAAYSLVEAMAYKLPVICSDDNGTSCYIRQGENGYIFRKKDAQDLASKIELLISDKETLVNFGKKSYELALTVHSPAGFSDFFKNRNYI